MVHNIVLDLGTHNFLGETVAFQLGNRLFVNVDCGVVHRDLVHLVLSQGERLNSGVERAIVLVFIRTVSYKQVLNFNLMDHIYRVL